MSSVSVFGFKAEAQLLRDAQSPDVVKAANQNNGAFAELREARLRCRQHAKSFVPGFEGCRGPGEGNDVGEGQVTGKMEPEVERFRLGTVRGSVKGID